MLGGKIIPLPVLIVLEAIFYASLLHCLIHYAHVALSFSLVSLSCYQDAFTVKVLVLRWIWRKVFLFLATNISFLCFSNSYQVMIIKLFGLNFSYIWICHWSIIEKATPVWMVMFEISVAYLHPINGFEWFDHFSVLSQDAFWSTF